MTEKQINSAFVLILLFVSFSAAMIAFAMCVSVLVFPWL